MAQKSGFFNQGADGQPTYDDMDQAKVNALMHGREAGVVFGVDNELKVTASGYNVMMDTGAAWLGEPCGWWYMNDTVVQLPVDVEVEGMKRCDRVVLRLDRGNDARTIQAVIKKGVAVAGDPTPPELVKNATVYEMNLYRFIITGGETEIEVIDESGHEYLDNCEYVGAIPGGLGKALVEFKLPSTATGAKLYTSTSPYDGTKSAWGTLVQEFADDSECSEGKWFKDDNGGAGYINGTTRYYKIVPLKNAVENWTQGKNECMVHRIGIAWCIYTFMDTGTVVTDLSDNGRNASVSTYMTGFNGNAAASVVSSQPEGIIELIGKDCGFIALLQKQNPQAYNVDIYYIQWRREHLQLDTNGVVRLITKSGGSWPDIESPSDSYDNNWMTVTMAKDAGENRKLYVNENIVASGNVPLGEIAGDDVLNYAKSDLPIDTIIWFKVQPTNDEIIEISRVLRKMVK